MLYVFFSFLTQKTAHLHKRNVSPLSLSDVFCDGFSLVLTTLFLLVPYKLYYWTINLWPRLDKFGWIISFVVGYAVFRIKQEFLINKQLEPEIFVDFARLDTEGRLRLDSFWTLRDMEKAFLKLEAGKIIKLYGRNSSGEEVHGKLGKLIFDHEKRLWVAELIVG